MPIRDGWYMEINEQWPGQAMALEVENVIFEGKSDYQDVLVFKSKTYGNVLVLDDAIQATERDEFAYQEMMVHPAMFAHSNPERVLVVGGGDGGCMREVLRHPGVKVADQCEIDKMVVDQAKLHLPKMAEAFSNPRCNLVIGDGKEFMRNKKDEYDVIIVDSSDPSGPAEGLFGEEFYSLVKQALKPKGVVVSQGECMWLHLELIKTMMDFSRKMFARVEYGSLMIPTYPSGQIGFLCCSREEANSAAAPAREVPKEIEDQLSYYNSEIHKAAFVLPTFVRRGLAP
jgi:spermidine synthase